MTGVWTQTDARYASRCNLQEGQFKCQRASKGYLQKVNLPTNYCGIYDCQSCIRTKESYIVAEDYELLKPEHFVLSEEIDNVTLEHNSFHECRRDDKEQCSCETEGCTGAEDFCKIFKCTEKARCICHLTYNKAIMTHVGSNQIIRQPEILNLEVCYFNKKTKMQKRRLLEFEKAVFNNENLTLTFIDPILTLSENGRVILRTEEYEFIIKVPDNRQITIPIELLAHKTTLSVIFIAETGASVAADITIAGKKYCRKSNCLFCRQAWKTINCWYPGYKNLYYVIGIILILVILRMLRAIFKIIAWMVKLILDQIILCVKIIRTIARFFLLLGAFAGTGTRDAIEAIMQALEHRRQNTQGLGYATIAILAMTLLLTETQADCSDYAIVHSDIKLCESRNEGSEECSLFTTAEVTLKNLQHQACIWLHSKDNVPLVYIKIKLEEVQCKFSTEKKYYTFPVETNFISEISCANYKKCNYGEFCQKRSYEGLHFESETEESRHFSGYSQCFPNPKGHGCFIIHRNACSFSRIYFKPELFKSYEVSRITGYTCEYQIAIEQQNNGTTSKLVVKDNAVLEGGLTFTFLGAYDQSKLVLQEDLVRRMGDGSEGHLVKTSETNTPQAGLIGAIQANQSYTTKFLFAEGMVDCDHFEDKFRCIETPQAINQITETQQYRLPMTKQLHKLYLHQGELHSKLIATSAVRFQLQFQNYRISMDRTTVCPSIEPGDIHTAGCFKCGILAQMTFKAKSACKPGLVEIQFQTIQVFTKAAHLSTDVTEVIIKFAAENRCYEEKVCLRSSSNINCRKLSFCLEEASIELLNIQRNSSSVQSSVLGTSIFDWQYFKGLNAAFYLFKFAGSILLCIGVTIMGAAACVTCVCRK